MINVHLMDLKIDDFLIYVAEAVLGLVEPAN